VTSGLRRRLRTWLLPTELPQLPLSAGRDALFVRLLGLLYFIAFASLWPQVPGLFGEHGLLPTEVMLGSVASQLGTRKYLLLPTVFWLSQTSTALLFVCGLGMLSGLLVGALRLTWPMLAVAWLCHLSFLAIGGPFLSFQWDALLSELGMLALLSVPIRWRRPQPLVLVALGRWLLLWLLIRLQFGSGWVKLAAGDPTWRNLTALHHHFETQPLPTLLGYYAHALPGVIKKALVVFTLITETLLPMFILVPRWHRLVLWPMLGLQLGILLTGNYGYFNLEVLVLLLLLVPPSWLSRLRPTPGPTTDEPSQITTPPSLLWGLPRVMLAAVLFCASLGHLLWTVRFRTSVPPVIHQAMQITAPLQAVSHYGPFASMTTTRPELVIEGSQDGNNWTEYSLRYKPGDVLRRPRWSAPHQPRLDWQFWFAALGKPSDSPWLEVLLLRLLEGSPDVLWLFESDPFQGRRPRYVRVRLYQYRFTTPSEQRRTGAYFVREAPLPFISPVGLSVSEP
jgi:hypothetical protein